MRPLNGNFILQINSWRQGFQINGFPLIRFSQLVSLWFSKCMVFHWKWFSFEFSNGALQEIIRNTYHDLRQKYLQYNIWNLNGNMFTKLLWKINISWTLIPIYYVIYVIYSWLIVKLKKQPQEVFCKKRC